MGSDGEKDVPVDALNIPEAQEKRGLGPAIAAKEKKTADELAAMILQDLRKVDGCPRLGISVTVYGLSPWNCLLTFGVEAGSVPNRIELQGFCKIITERLKRLYTIAP
jgi:hypothetical protein